MQTRLQPERDNRTYSHPLQPLQQLPSSTSGNLSSTQPPTYNRQHPHESKGPLRHAKIFTQHWVWIEMEIQVNQSNLRKLDKNQRIKMSMRIQLLQT